MSGDLIDTTEMYLRTILELIEEGQVPLRARIAERLGQSGPTVSQTVARMERDGLVRVAGDRHLELTALGHERAVTVMRRHRLAECLLVGVIGLEWEYVHEEACRWEHVMSGRVERHVYELLGRPQRSPYGNPIPGLAELDADTGPQEDFREGLTNLVDLAGEEAVDVVVHRLGEPLQSDAELLVQLQHAGVRPGGRVRVARSDLGVSLGPVGDADADSGPGGDSVGSASLPGASTEVTDSLTVLELANSVAVHIFARNVDPA
ncbi:MAG: metal-dependent transcriptional regulator [Actinomycetales bacterium]